MMTSVNHAAGARDTSVASARSVRPDYGALDGPAPAPELPSGVVTSVANAAVRELLLAWGLDREHAGTAQWNPLGCMIQPGARVILKPNWVLHWNQSGRGMDCLVTHASVIEAALEYVALARPGRVVVGDAPIQGCDFAALRAACGLDEMVERVRSGGLDVELADFRRTVLPGGRLGGPKLDDCRQRDRFVLFDLAGDSLLEPVSADADKFRVTVYNPDLMRRTHAPGRHQYLIAREVLEADVALNLPKLKCHKKACVTGALKNVVGINGNKEYLPHHRKGGDRRAGDCYEGYSRLKQGAEDLLDAANRRSPGMVQAMLGRTAEAMLNCAVRLGADNNLEGSWHGNDTIWRTALDLQRILLFGRIDGTLADEPQRTVINITDAIVAGEGDGPLAPTPVASGFLTGALNAAAADWVHALLMGFEPEAIPLLRHAFDRFRWPLAAFRPAEIRLRTSEGEQAADEIGTWAQPFQAPSGWRGHCERAAALTL